MTNEPVEDGLARRKAPPDVVQDKLASRLDARDEEGSHGARDGREGLDESEVCRSVGRSPGERRGGDLVQSEGQFDKS